MLPLVIAVVVMGFAIFLQKMGQNVFENESTFKLSVVIFFVVYIVSAVVLQNIGPSLDEPASVSSLVSRFNLMDQNSLTP